jgi:adenylylsulfate kinase-like enzyme
VVIVISGPVASGKSTVARALAREVERRGRTAAAIDLDLMYETLEHNGARKDDDRKWQRARLAAAALACCFEADGIDVVIVEGDFLVASGRSTFVAALGRAAALRFVTLWVSFDEAAARVAGDATRTFSRDLPFLRQHFDEAERDRHSLPRTDLFVETGSSSPDQAASTIADWALGEPL